jgi:SAM-dependent methyltransferase
MNPVPAAGCKRFRVLALLAPVLVSACNSWTGGGFNASGPEMPRLAEALSLRSGMVVADVGAGKGQLTLALAEAVGSGGRVFSSEIDPARLRAIREKVAAAGLGNVTLVEAKAAESGLPAGCCDAIVLRRVYHHVTEPAATNASLLRALRPGGLLAVIDIPPLPFFPDRSTLGVASRIVVDELTASGFELLALRTDWPGRGPLESYCALFRKPRRATSSFATPRASRGRRSSRGRSRPRAPASSP